MKILLFGVSNVGKTTVGRALAEEMGYTFFDIDEVIETEYGSLNTFFNEYQEQRERDAIRLKLVKELIAVEKNSVIAMSPVAYITGYDILFRKKNIRCFELYDKAENILKRLVFPGVQVPEGYSEKHKQYYLREIQDDLNYFHSVYRNHMEMVHMNGMCVDEVVEKVLLMIDE